jgi:TonB family protein
MFDEHQKVHPRSPVQPGQSAAPYFVAAVIAAILVWTAQQYWIADSNSEPARAPAGQAAPGQATQGDLRTVFSADDYPASAQANGEEGTVQAKLTVSTSGRVSACEIVRSSGHKSLDDATCSVLQRRARFTPARAADGRPIASTVVSPPIVWRLEG